MWLKLWTKKWTNTKLNKRLVSKLDLSIKSIKKTKRCFIRFPNTEISEIGTMFYGFLAVILHIVSIYTTIRRLNQIIFAELVKFSIENYELTNVTQSKVRSFLFENFSAPIFFIFASIVFVLMFAYSVIFKMGNMGNDDKQLGIDLILIDGNLCANHHENNLKNSISTFMNANEIEESTNNSASPVANTSSSSSSSLSSLSSRHASSPSPNEATVNDDFINKKINIIPKNAAAKSIDFFSTISFMNTKRKTYFHNLNNRSKTKFFYLPAFNCCFHLISCLCLFITKLHLNQFNAGKYTTPNFRETQVINKVENFQNELNSLKLIRYFYMNRNNTKAIDHLFNELKEKIILKKKFDLEANSTSNTLKFKNKIINKFQIDLNFINYSFAFLVFTLKFTRIYFKMNPFYALLVFIHLLLLMISNITMYPAFETMLKNSLKSKNESKSVSIFDTLKNETFISNSNLYKLIPETFDNQQFMLITYISSWILNLIYLTSLNVFAASFYKDAQLKIKYKFESYLNYYSANETKSNAYGDASKKIIYDNNIVNPFLQTEHANSIVLYHGNDDDGSGTKQYKAIISGIFLLLITEIFRLPFVYSCFIKYFIYSFDTYLLALSFQLVYLIFNAVFWIILSFKKKWSVHFTPQFRILLWHELYSQHFNMQRKLFLNHNQENLNRNSTSSQTLSTEMSKYDLAEDTSAGLTKNKNLLKNIDLINKPAISKLKQSKLNNSLNNNSKLFKKKQQNNENNYTSMKNEYEIEKNDIFVIDNKPAQKNLENGTNFLKKKEIYLNKNIFNLQKKDNLEECASSDSSDSSKCKNNLKKTPIEICQRSNLNNAKLNYFTKEYISVPTYTTTCNLKVCEHQMPTYRNTSLESILEHQKMARVNLIKSKENFHKETGKNFGENKGFSSSKKTISSIDYLKEQVNQWKFDQYKNSMQQNKRNFSDIQEVNINEKSLSKH